MSSSNGGAQPRAIESGSYALRKLMSNFALGAIVEPSRPKAKQAKPKAKPNAEPKAKQAKPQAKIARGAKTPLKSKPRSHRRAITSDAQMVGYKAGARFPDHCVDLQLGFISFGDGGALEAVGTATKCATDSHVSYGACIAYHAPDGSEYRLEQFNGKGSYHSAVKWLHHYALSVGEARQLKQSAKAQGRKRRRKRRRRR